LSIKTNSEQNKFKQIQTAKTKFLLPGFEKKRKEKN